MAQAQLVQHFCHEIAAAKAEAETHSKHCYTITGNVTYDACSKVLGLTFQAQEGATIWNFEGSAENVHAPDVEACTEIDGEIRCNAPIVPGHVETFKFMATHQLFHVTFYKAGVGCGCAKPISLKWLNAGTVSGLAGKTGTGSGTWN